VETITLSTAGGQTSIFSGDSIQIIVSLDPPDADSQRVELVIVPITGTATFNSIGCIIGADPGEVRIIGSATDGFGASDTLELLICHQTIQVEQIEILTISGDTIINKLGGTLEPVAHVYPLNASNPEITWEVINGTGEATLINDSIVQGISNGSFILVAHATDGSGVSNNRTFWVNDPLVSVRTLANQGLMIYPNPAENAIRMVGEIDYPASVIIIDQIGNNLLMKIVHGPDQSIEVSTLKSGLYFISIRSHMLQNNTIFMKK
jgi:hypothetical protein